PTSSRSARARRATTTPPSSISATERPLVSRLASPFAHPTKELDGGPLAALGRLVLRSLVAVDGERVPPVDRGLDGVDVDAACARFRLQAPHLGAQGPGLELERRHHVLVELEMALVGLDLVALRALAALALPDELEAVNGRPGRRDREGPAAPLEALRPRETLGHRPGGSGRRDRAAAREEAADLVRLQPAGRHERGPVGGEDLDSGGHSASSSRARRRPSILRR